MNLSELSVLSENIVTADAKSQSLSGGVLLPGLDGSNPLAFLAALGVLRMLDRQTTDSVVRMAWTDTGRCWSPYVTNAGANLDELIDLLKRHPAISDVWSLDKRLPFDAERFRAASLDALRDATVRDRHDIDLVAGLGVECMRDDKGAFEDTALRMLRSADAAGNGLLAYACAIFEGTTPAQLRMALGERWTYADEGSALRWDPAEDRNYAHQWRNPSTETTLSERGANRLGLEALGALPTVPVGSGVATAAFGRPTGPLEALTWPIWEPLIPLSVVKSLVMLPELQQSAPPRESVVARGVVAVYRSDRYRPSKYYSNFTPAQRIA